MAYGYALDAAAGTVALAIYDPNHPDDDTVRLRIALDGRTGRSATTTSPVRRRSRASSRCGVDPAEDRVRPSRPQRQAKNPAPIPTEERREAADEDRRLDAPTAAIAPKASPPTGIEPAKTVV